MKRWAWVAILAAGLTTAVARGADETSSWKPVNAPWPGGPTASVWKMTAWPGKDQVIVSTRANGLWSSTDGGDTWGRMGEPGKTPPNAGQAVQFVFDPNDPNTMWTSGMYNYGVWKTADGGKTFTHISNVSKDDGKTWAPFGEPLPFKARGFAYDALRKCFFAWEDHAEAPRKDGEVVRWDLPADMDSAFLPKSADLTVWDGEGYADGNGWISPAGKSTFRVTSTEHYNGKQSLEYHAEGVASSSGGWNWANWNMAAVTDLSGFESLAFYVKVTGDKPAKVPVSLACGPSKVESERLDLATYSPDFTDGQWHRVTVPLKDLYGASKFDPKTAYELRFLTDEARESTFDMYVDVVRLLRAPSRKY
jgi:hypothetical protein